MGIKLVNVCIGSSRCRSVEVKPGESPDEALVRATAEYEAERAKDQGSGRLGYQAFILAFVVLAILAVALRHRDGLISMAQGSHSVAYQDDALQQALQAAEISRLMAEDP